MSEPPAPGAGGRTAFSQGGALLAALGAFFLGVAVTFAVAQTLAASAHSELEARFEGAARRLEYEVQRRISRPAYGLRGIAAAYAAVGELTPAQFRDHVAARNLESEFPGVVGFGMARRVERADVPAFEEKMRAADPQFRLQTSGHKPDLYVVTDVEPRPANHVVWGYDLAQEATRRQAIERAVQTGALALSDRISVLQDPQRRAGWLMFLPVFRKGSDPQDAVQRKRALVGLVYAPIVAAQVLADVRRSFESEVDFRLYDGRVEEGLLLYDSVDDPRQGLVTGARGGWDGRLVRATHRIEVGGQELAIDLASTPSLEASTGSSLPLQVSIIGLLLSALLAASVWQLASARRRAEAAAERMTGDLSRAARELRASEAFLEQAQRIASVGGWEVDLETMSLRLSQQMLRLFDLPPNASPTIEEFIRFFDPPSQERIEQATLVAIRDGMPWDLELRMNSAQGVSRWVRTVGQVEREGGRSRRLIGTLQDITERKRAEQALEESEHLMRVIADNLPGRVAYWDRHLRCAFANRVVAETFGRNPDSLVGSFLPDVVGELWPQFEKPVAAALRGEAQIFEREETGKGGQVRTMLSHYVPDVQSGEVLGFFVLVLDVTELKEAREAARQASAAKGQFLANTSHEIRTPMNAIIGMLTLLGQTALTARQADYVGKAEGAARSLLGLLNDILDFSKVEAGKLVLDPRPFRLETLLRDLSVILSANLRSDNVEVLYDLDPALPASLVGDDMRLRQVLINLGGNAVKFTERGEVVVGVRQVARSGEIATIEFSVRDTGIGIAPEQQSRIFEGFTQAQASTVREYGGTGLGLAISQRLVQLMGGHLQLESALGEGSRFFFQLGLPLGAEEAAGQAAPAAQGAQPGQELSGVRVLVVEDNRNNQQIARELLASRGAGVEVAGDGRQGVERVTAAGDGFDIVLMDIQMPVMDGFAATRAIRAAGFDALPIVAMTANAMAGDREASLAAGMNAHVGKPFDLDELVATILRFVKGAPEASFAHKTLSRAVDAPEAGDHEVDLPAAVRRLGGDAGFYRELFPSIRSDGEGMLQRLELLVANGECDEAGRLFHTIKGLAGTLGATGLARASGAAERAMNEGPGDPVEGAGHLARTRRAWDHACETIAAQLAAMEDKAAAR